MKEQYKCKSYYDDNNVLRDCACDKCWENKYDNVNERWESGRVSYGNETIGYSNPIDPFSSDSQTKQ